MEVEGSWAGTMAIADIEKLHIHKATAMALALFVAVEEASSVEPHSISVRDLSLKRGPVQFAAVDEVIPSSAAELVLVVEEVVVAQDSTKVVTSLVVPKVEAAEEATNLRTSAHQYEAD